MLYESFWDIPWAFGNNFLTNDGLTYAFGRLWKFHHFLKLFRETFNHSMRKRICISEPETWTKRCFNICSLDQYDIELKRIEKFCTLLSQSAHQKTFLGNSRFWRHPPGFGQLAPGAPVLLYKSLANELKMLYESFWGTVWAFGRNFLTNGGLRYEFCDFQKLSHF